MSARWLLVFAVDTTLGAGIPAMLARTPRAVVASERRPGGADAGTVLTVEVDADPALVAAVTRQVREIDPGAERLHDGIIDVPDAEGTVTAAVDFDADDEPTPCGHCAQWRFEWVFEADGGSILREWHREDCPVHLAWL